MDQPDDATLFAIDDTVDIATLLSQRLQYNVRQGKEFHVHKAQVSLTAVNNVGDLDVGMAASGSVRMCPVTKNSKAAWKHAFGIWQRQKNLRIGATGSITRYDDFEVAWDSNNLVSGRTSTLYAEGLGDTAAESVTIYGASSSGSDITLEDLYESQQGQEPTSRFPIGNAVVKTSKYTQVFPDPTVHFVGGAFSTVAHTDLGQGDSGAIYQSEPLYIADSSCLGGVVQFKCNLLAEDVTANTADTMYVTLTLTVSMGPSLLGAPKRKSSGYTRKGGKGRMTRGRYRRR